MFNGDPSIPWGEHTSLPLHLVSRSLVIAMADCHLPPAAARHSGHTFSLSRRGEPEQPTTAYRQTGKGVKRMSMAEGAK